MATYSVMLHKGIETHEEIIDAKSKEDANKKAEAKHPNFIANHMDTKKVG